MGFLALAIMMAMGFAGAFMPDEGQGNDADERLEGEDDPDRLSGGGGNDLLLAARGDDSVAGGDGSDWIFAEGGNDLIDGGDGNDVILPGTGRDTVMAGAGDDFIEAADLVDDIALGASLQGERRSDNIDFRYDFDALPDAPDLIDAGDGDDTIVAGPGDTVTGGAGADEIALGDWGAAASDDPAADRERDPPPVVITDFDPDEDVLTFAWRETGSAPVLTKERGPQSNDVMLRADGRVAAILRDLPEGLDVTQIDIRIWRHVA